MRVKGEGEGEGEGWDQGCGKDEGWTFQAGGPPGDLRAEGGEVEGGEVEGLGVMRGSGGDEAAPPS